MEADFINETQTIRRSQTVTNTNWIQVTIVNVMAFHSTRSLYVNTFNQNLASLTETNNMKQIKNNDS